MDDPVLMSRLEALRYNLDVVSQKMSSSAWRTDPPLPDTRAEMLVNSLWVGLETYLNTLIRQQRDQLVQVEATLSAAPADSPIPTAKACWDKYNRILERSQSLLDECLEIIGTLAIRNKDLDQHMLYVADELMRDCLQLSIGDERYYLLVNSLGGVSFKPHARIIRLRFPEWTIWELPLAAHELGHVAIEVILAKERDQEIDLQVLRPCLEDQRAALIAWDTELNRKRQSGDTAEEKAAAEAEAIRWAEGRLRVFLADAFATYTMGPAYACSALMLRLNPSVEAHGDRPSDVQRARVVLEMLRQMNGPETALYRPYTEIIEKLEEDWERTLAHAGRAGALSADDENRLRESVKKLNVAWGQTLHGTAMYPNRGENDGWKLAVKWSDDWFNEWQSGRPLLTQPSNPAGRLRDVLNASWRARLPITGDTEAKKRAYAALAEVGHALCRATIAARAPGPRALAGVAAPGGGVP